MTKEDIIGGLRNAISQGATLKEAMQSFYNAGYEKEDIIEAARELQMQNFSQLNKTRPLIPQQPNTNIQNIQPTKTQIQKLPVTPGTNNQIQTIQQKSDNKIGWIVFFIVLLIILIGVAISLIFFKDKIIEWVGSTV
ncbi:MAG: hypothetical protein AABY22_22090 [Nanoarchaeota archaeon]